MRRARATVAAGAAVTALLLAACTSSSPAARESGAPTAAGPTTAGAAGRSSPGPSAQSPGSSAQSPRSSTSPGSSTSSRPGSGARTATVLGSGDVLVHPQLTAQAARDARAEGRTGYDFGPMFASIAPDVRSADLATCELETPLAAPQGPFTGWPDFDAPPQVLTALRGVGYRTCTTASNHSIDQGYSGLTRTLDELDAAGIGHTGSARSRSEADTPLIVTLPDGVRIGQLAYSFGFNGVPLPAGKPWLANLIDIPAILAAAHRLKQAGADIVVLSMHWGTEYDHLATDEQRTQARQLLRSPDIDLILGDHAHVVQPAERIDGKWVFFCMGNQISRHADPVAEGRQGVMPRVTFTEVAPHRFRATTVQAIPTWMEDDPQLRLIDLPQALASTGTTAAHRAADEAAHRAIVGYLDAYGAVRDGLSVP